MCADLDPTQKPHQLMLQHHAIHHRQRHSVGFGKHAAAIQYLQEGNSVEPWINERTKNKAAVYSRHSFAHTTTIHL